MKSYYTNDLIPKSIEKSTYHREKKVLLPEVRVLLTSFMIYDMRNNDYADDVMFIIVHSQHDIK